MPSPRAITTHIEPDAATSLRRALLRWYRTHRRDLPWRPTEHRPANPYHVLVSEAMLQQTQVATVIDYFNRFVARFPTIRSMADAPEQEVLRLWQGLGYYRRARNLHAAAKAIVERHAGHVPAQVDALLELPGIGRYTAGAVASIAYDTRAPIVDGNVARVLSRLFALDAPIDAPATRAALWQLAEALLPSKYCGDFNQALMELGALVCVPRGPACLACPLTSSCGALKLGLTEQLPRKAQRRQPKPVAHHIIAVRHGDKWLLVRRGDRGLWAGMWQFPTCESIVGDSEVATISKWVRESFDLRIGPVQSVTAFNHQTTHRSITFHLWRTKTRNEKSGGDIDDSRKWRTLNNLDDLPLPNPQRRAVELLRQPDPSQQQ